LQIIHKISNNHNSMNTIMEYKQCSKCIMDTSDTGIQFDTNGVCNHCREFEEVTSQHWFPNKEGSEKLDRIIKQIQFEGKNNEYDCILGLSGGADSSYLAVKAKAWGLRPLVVHVDAGWNSELAVANIEKVVKYCDYDLHTHVVDWEEMRDLHLAYLKAGIANQDVPQDHVFFASLYHFATKNNIRYILNGGNLATEGIFPKSWLGSAMDSINLKAIHKKFGTHKLKTYNTISFFDYYIRYPLFKKMRTIRPLNYMVYDKAQAIAELEQLVGYKPYERKHGESLFTKLYQNYYLPEKFGFDKRKPHLSSLIVSKQMTKEDALKKLAEPLYDPQELEIDITYFCKKLRITRKQFNELMLAPSHHHTDFPTWDIYYRYLKKGQRLLERAFNRRISVYS
jgi:aminotransferase